VRGESERDWGLAGSLTGRQSMAVKTQRSHIGGSGRRARPKGWGQGEDLGLRQSVCKGKSRFGARGRVLRRSVG
jgi:hypothetical protein